MPTTDNISFNDNNSLDDNYTLEDIDLNSNNNDTINNDNNNDVDDDDKKYTHRFDLLGDIEEGNENIDNFNSDSYSKQTRNTNNKNNNSNSFDTGSRRQSITSSFKSNLNSIRSHGSKNRRGSTSNNNNNNNSLRKRRDSSFDYSPFMHSNNNNNNNDTYESSHLSSSAHSTSSSYQNRNTDDREKNSYFNDRDTKANTAFNNRTFHFEVIPSEMPDFSTTDTSSSISDSNNNKSSNNNNDDTSSSIITSNDSSDLNNNGREPIPNQHILLKPKQIHQNPLTPQVLPQGFTPINKWSRYKAKYHKEWLAEFLGTFILISLGDGCSIQNLLNQQSKINEYNELIESLKTSGNSSLTTSNGDVVSIVGNMLSGVTTITQNYNISVQLAWAGSVVAAFFAAGGSSISGAHLSWCITLINFLFRGSPKFKLFFPYLIAQLLGAYVAGLTLFGLYHSVIEEVFPNWRTSSDFTSMFVTVPLDYLSTGRQFVSEFMGSFYLVIGIFAMTDPYNNTSPEVFPVYLFFFIFTLNASMSLQTGAALNFSRDLGPRLALWTVGVHHSLLFDSNHHYFWIPMVAPLLGGLLGAFAYDLLIFRGQESWVNKPWYQNRANLKKRFKKVKKFLKKILLIKKFRKNSYYNDRGKNRKKNRSYNIDSSDEDIDINDSKFDESDEIYGGHNDNDNDDDDESEERRDKNNFNSGVRFVDDNASLTTTASSDINPDNFDEILHRNNKRRGSITNSTGAYSLNNIPEEEFSLEEEEEEQEEGIQDMENYNDHENLNFNYYDNTLSKPKNVFRSYNNANLRPHESNGSKKKKEISFKSNKHTRKFVPTVEKEEKM
ncbi:hypothetical protein ACO0SA_003722 [Hanseniaspora valbyensis]